MELRNFDTGAFVESGAYYEQRRESKEAPHEILSSRPPSRCSGLATSRIGFIAILWFCSVDIVEIKLLWPQQSLLLLSFGLHLWGDASRVKRGETPALRRGYCRVVEYRYRIYGLDNTKNG